MTEINQNSHFYIRASAEVPLLSGIQCVTSVTFSQPSPVAGLSWGTLKTEAANFPEEALLFTFYDAGSQPSFRYHAKWKTTCLGFPLQKPTSYFYTIEIIN